METLKILVVDDDSMNREMVAALLPDCFSDYRTVIETAKDGEEALQAFLDAKNSRKPFNAVVSDNDMPKMKGSRLAEHVKMELPDTAFVIMSGEVQDVARHRGIDAIFGKPASIIAISEVILGLLKRQKVA